MARKARRRISYVLPLAKSAGGHRLGVNGLAVDSTSSILYSGGRDGVICAWDLHLDLQNTPSLEYDAKPPAAPATTLRQQVQAHTHWINDVALAHSNQALVSASSDITVKLWRPAATDGTPPQTIGLHSDYVKTLAVPSPTSDWVASGGLDRKVNVWDLSGAGQRLSIDFGEDEMGTMLSREKGSVYALAATEAVIAAGGPEGAIKMWDVRSGKRITKLVGHTDNIRDVLVGQDGTTILTASSDWTVKVWSTIAGRCMFTLTMHDTSVWSLFSSTPDLSIFYSSDKSGLVVKTDTRNALELDEGLSVAVCQDHEGVHKITAAGDCIWTATSRPSINRFQDVCTDNMDIEIPEGYNIPRSSVVSQRTRYPSMQSQRDLPQSPPRAMNGNARRKLPLKHALRLSNTARFPVPVHQDGDQSFSGNRRSVVDAQLPGLAPTIPVRNLPEFSIEGQNGIIKHVMLNDRKRVLTLDTAGEVVMWDLLQCVPIRSYGKRHLEDVKEEVTTTAVVANWCTVDTRTGSVAVVLEENTCFDAEMYADELDLNQSIEWREDQRINLGKWVLRYLFADVINEEARRDQKFRETLMDTKSGKTPEREKVPMSIQIPEPHMNGWTLDPSAPASVSTIRPTTGGAPKLQATPSFNIGLATPGLLSPTKSVHSASALSPADEASASESSARLSREQLEGKSDYFSTPGQSIPVVASPDGTSQPAQTPGEAQDPAAFPSDGTPKEPATPGLFGKKFRMNMTFGGMKKLGRTQTNDKTAPVDEKDGNESDSKSSDRTGSSRIVEENLLGTVQKIRFAYEESLHQQIQTRHAHENGMPVPLAQLDLPSAITPSAITETPVLSPPPNTVILIQEDRPEAGGVADLFESTVGALGEMCDLVERAAPMWLGDALLKNQLPLKDVVKISFVLEPWHGQLPAIASEANNRLNANRMLRAKKIVAYVAERIEPAASPAPSAKKELSAATAVLKPEEYLELWCQNQIVPPDMTLATIRSHLWKGGGDVLLYYKANGRKPIKHARGASGYPPS